MDVKLLPWVFALIYVTECKKAGDYPNIQSKSCGIGKLKSHVVTSRIVSGQNATLGEFPWMVLIHSQRQVGENFVDHFCGGALISERFVVTAANCFLFRFAFKYTRVIAGTNDMTDDTYFSSVSALIIHESFNISDPKGRHFDIALLQLSDDNLRPQLLNESIPKSYIINTVCLPEKGLTFDKTERALLCGFGEIVEHPNPDLEPNFLLTKAEYNIEDSSNCDSKQLCAHEWAHPSCFRDTGSPLVQFDGERAVLIGILTTVGNESRDCGKNWQYFTRVSYFVDWINDKITNMTESLSDKKENPPHFGSNKFSGPSLWLVISVFVVLGAGSLCLTLYVIKKKRDSDLSAKNYFQKSTNNSKDSKQDSNNK